MPEFIFHDKLGFGTVQKKNKGSVRVLFGDTCETVRASELYPACGRYRGYYKGQTIEYQVTELFEEKSPCPRMNLFAVNLSYPAFPKLIRELVEWGMAFTRENDLDKETTSAKIRHDKVLR
jgi:hypothetical protein